MILIENSHPQQNIEALGLPNGPYLRLVVGSLMLLFFPSAFFSLFFFTIVLTQAVQPLLMKPDCGSPIS